jgi:hypothetical protein
MFNNLPPDLLSGKATADTLADPVGIRYPVLRKSDFPLSKEEWAAERLTALTKTELRHFYEQQKRNGFPGGVGRPAANTVENMEKQKKRAANPNLQPPLLIGFAGVDNGALNLPGDALPSLQ